MTQHVTNLSCIWHVKTCPSIHMKCLFFSQSAWNLESTLFYMYCQRSYIGEVYFGFKFHLIHASDWYSPVYYPTLSVDESLESIPPCESEVISTSTDYSNSLTVAISPYMFLVWEQFQEKTLIRTVDSYALFALIVVNKVLLRQSA